jgi:predicted DNA-binding transcriptional regulator YafY
VTGRRGGHVIDKARTLPPLNFTAAEMLAMAVSLAGAEATPFASALRKVLAAAQTAQAAQLADRVRLIGTRSAVPLAIPGGDHCPPRPAAALPGPARRHDLPRRGTGGVRRDAGALVPGRLAPAGQGTRAFRQDRIHAAADTGEPDPHRSYRSYRDLDVNIPHALVHRVDLAS